MTFEPGDRVTYRSDYDWEGSTERHGTFVVGEGRHAMNRSTGRIRPSFFFEVGPGFALVQFDGQKAAQIVSVDNLGRA